MRVLKSERTWLFSAIGEGWQILGAAKKRKKERGGKKRSRVRLLSRRSYISFSKKHPYKRKKGEISLAFPDFFCFPFGSFIGQRANLENLQTALRKKRIGVGFVVVVVLVVLFHAISFFFLFFSFFCSHPLRLHLHPRKASPLFPANARASPGNNGTGVT